MCSRAQDLGFFLFVVVNHFFFFLVIEKFKIQILNMSQRNKKKLTIWLLLNNLKTKKNIPCYIYTMKCRISWLHFLCYFGFVADDKFTYLNDMITKKKKFFYFRSKTKKKLQLAGWLMVVFFSSNGRVQKKTK